MYIFKFMVGLLEKLILRTKYLFKRQIIQTMKQLLTQNKNIYMIEKK